MLEVYEEELELLEELVDFLGDPGLLPVPADAHVAGVVGCPLVVTGPAAPFDGEAFIDVLEVVAHMSGVAVDFFWLFAACVGEVAVGVGLAVTLEDAREGAGLGAVVVAAAIVFAVNVHPGDGQVLHGATFGQPDVVVGHGVGGAGTHAVLHVLHQGVAEHGAVAEARDEYAARVNAVVLVQGGECLGEEVVVGLALVPQAANRIERDKDVVAVLVEHLLAVVRSRMVVVGLVVHEVLAIAAVAVQREQHLVRLGIVVVLGQGDEVVAGVAADLNLELVAILDALGLFQLGGRAAALTRSRLVADGVTEFECRFRRDCLFEFHVEGRVECAERHGERVETFGDKLDGFACLSIFQECVCALCPERTVQSTVRRELEILLGATDRNLCKIGATGMDLLAQVQSAGTLQRLFENLIAERVVNLHLDGRIAALLVRKNPVVDADVSDGVSERWSDCIGSVLLFFVDCEFALVVRRCGLAFLEEAYRGALKGLAFFVRNRTCDGIS